MPTFKDHVQELLSDKETAILRDSVKELPDSRRVSAGSRYELVGDEDGVQQ